jgi:DNA-binding NtrC family response regulator
MMMSEGSKGPRVLVVDDERIIADSLTRILSLSGFDATAAYSGEEARDEARTLKPDVLVCDVMMPGISGIEAALEICGFLPNCRVIFISGQLKTREFVERTKNLALRFEFLDKPFHPLELIELLNHRDGSH